VRTLPHPGKFNQSISCSDRDVRLPHCLQNKLKLRLQLVLPSNNRHVYHSGYSFFQMIYRKCRHPELQFHSFALALIWTNSSGFSTTMVCWWMMIFAKLDVRTTTIFSLYFSWCG
jgi:hypothetical protein